MESEQEGEIMSDTKAGEIGRVRFERVRGRKEGM